MDINIYERDDSENHPSFCHSYEFLQNEAKNYVESAMDSSSSNNFRWLDKERDGATFILYFLQMAVEWGYYNDRNWSLDVYVKNIPNDHEKKFLEAQRFIERRFGSEKSYKET